MTLKFTKPGVHAMQNPIWVRILSRFLGPLCYIYVLEMDTSLNSTYKLLNSFYDHRTQSSQFFPRQGCVSLNLPCLELHKASNRAEQITARIYDTALKVRILLPFIITVFPENLSPHLTMHLLPPLGKPCCLFPRCTSLWIFSWTSSRPRRQWEEKH